MTTIRTKRTRGCAASGQAGAVALCVLCALLTGHGTLARASDVSNSQDEDLWKFDWYIGANEVYWDHSHDLTAGADWPCVFHVEEDGGGWGESDVIDGDVRAVHEIAPHGETTGTPYERYFYVNASVVVDKDRSTGASFGSTTFQHLGHFDRFWGGMSYWVTESNDILFYSIDVHGKHSETRTIAFGGTLDGRNVVPANSSPRAGNAALVLEEVSNLFTLTVALAPLNPAAIEAVEISTGPPGGNGTLIWRLEYPELWTQVERMSAFRIDDMPFPAEYVPLLQAGRTYVTVCTHAFPDGEVRAQLISQADVPGDLNDDGCVDQQDLGILLADWGCTAQHCAGDCDGDGDTDHSDLGVLLAHWGEGCR